MIVSSLFAAAVATANPQAATPPADAHAGHAAKAAEGTNLACCDTMAKGEGCECCKHGSEGGHVCHVSRHNSRKPLSDYGDQLLVRVMPGVT